MSRRARSSVLLPLFAVPAVYVVDVAAGGRAGAEERVAAHHRLARHLFLLGTTAPPGKELRVAGIGEQLVDASGGQRGSEWYAPVARARWATRCGTSAAWAVFGAAYVGAIVYVASGLDASVGDVVLVLAAGSRLSVYVGAAVGELGFLRGIWLDSSRRLAWLEDYAAGPTRTRRRAGARRTHDGIRLEHVSFRYPGTDRLVLDDVDLELPAGIGGRGGRRERRRQDDARQAAVPACTRRPAGRITVDGVDLARCRTDELAGAGWPARSRTSSASSSRACTTVGVGDLPRMDDGPAVEAAVGRAGADDVIDRLAGRPRHPARADVGRRRRGRRSGSGRSWRWRAGSCATSRCCWCSTSRPRRSTPRPSTPCSSGSPRRPERRRQRTAITILVSHRFSTVRMADLIVVLDGARVVEVGTHEELMARGGQYAELYSIQAAAYR